MKKHQRSIGLKSLFPLLMIVTLSTTTKANDVVVKTILAEARGEGEAGMYAVACVISQRSKNRGISAEKVCLQKWQFSCWNANDPQRGKLNSLLKLKEVEYAKNLAKHIHNLDRGYTGFADHYHSKNVKPHWSKGKKPVKVIGNHLFFKLR